MYNNSICFIGGGNMAQAMVAGLINNGYEPAKITVVDRNDDKLQKLNSVYGVLTSKDITSTASNSDVVVLAIKPQQMLDVLPLIKDDISSQKIILTVIAGVRAAVYERVLGIDTALARVIPNTPSGIGYGASGVYFNSEITDSQKKDVMAIIKTMGVVAIADTEDELDLISACSGSGTAYFYRFMEAMVEAVEKRGLSSDKSQKLVMQTCLGAAEMVKQSNESIAKLRENVTSNKGTTAESLRVFNEMGISEMVDKAIQANIDRSKELSKMIK